MKFVDDARPKWLHLYSRAFGSPYATIMRTVERLANFLEAEENTFEDWTAFLRSQENTEGFRLSVNDIGEIFVLLSSYWRYGEEFMEHIGYVEQKLVAENVEYRLSVLSQDASEKAKFQ